MPHVVNGIGTWYHGKSNIETYSAVCQSCKREGVLTSYDTGLYFVIFFIPIFPLGRKHIIDECPHCRRHGVVPLQEWEKMRVRVDETIAAYRDNPQDSETAAEAIKLTVGYRLRETFFAIAGDVEANLNEDQEMLGLVAEGYTFFSRMDKVETVYRRLLELEDSPENRERLAYCLMKLDRPDEAEPLLQHIIEQGIPDKVGLIYMLAQMYQLAGNHEKALDYFTHCETIDPRMTADANFVRLRDASVAKRETGEKVNPRQVLEKAKQEQQRAKFKRYAPVVAVLLILAYLGVAIVMGRVRTVFLVSGLETAYTVKLNGISYQLDPQEPKQISMPEGRIRVEFTDPRFSVPPYEINVSTPLLTRPITRQTIVVNPDQTAMLIKLPTYYSKDASAHERHEKDMTPELFAGKPVHYIKNVDYPFESFPESIEVDSSRGDVRKTRLTFFTALVGASPYEALYMVSNALDPKAVNIITEQLVRLHPTDPVYYSVLDRLVPAEERARFLKTGLDVRPLNTDWHRSYIRAMSAANKDKEAEQQYTAMFKQQSSDNMLRYLAGYATVDHDKAIAIIRQAATGPSPCAQATLTLARDALSNAQFPDALRYARMALAAQPQSEEAQGIAVEACIANSQYDEALRIARSMPKGEVGRFIRSYTLEFSAFAAAGRQAELSQELQRSLDESKRIFHGMGPALIPGYLSPAACYATGNIAGYLAEMKKAERTDACEAALTSGNVALAENACRQDNSSEAYDYLNCYIVARQKGQTAEAASLLAKSIEMLKKDGHVEREFAAALEGHATQPIGQLLKEGLDYRDKAIVLTALGLKDPRYRSQCFALARTLNFDRQFPHLLLESALQAK